MARTLALEVDRNGLEVLDRAECLELLSSLSIGRVGTTAGALPVVLPVRFQVVGDEIVFRAGRGSMLDAGLAGTVVAFEADDFDPLQSSGWSVVATGVARRLRPDELPPGSQVRARRSDDGDVDVAVSTELVSGRRIVAD